jgi:hypothetical protein
MGSWSDRVTKGRRARRHHAAARHGRPLVETETRLRARISLDGGRSS